MDEISYEYDIKRLSLDKQRKDTLLTFRAISPKHALAQAIRSSQGKLINNLNRDDRIVVELGTRFGEKKLPNCPHCGSKPVLHHSTGVDKRVICKNCDWGWEDDEEKPMKDSVEKAIDTLLVIEDGVSLNKREVKPRIASETPLIHLLAQAREEGLVELADKAQRMIELLAKCDGVLVAHGYDENEGIRKEVEDELGYT